MFIPARYMTPFYCIGLVLHHGPHHYSYSYSYFYYFFLLMIHFAVFDVCSHLVSGAILLVLI